jgi:prolyl oligopeptidase
MKSHILFFPALLLLNTAFSQTYSDFKTGQVDTFYGKIVHDPYRTLEDTSNAKVKTWMIQESDKTRTFFNSLPGRKKFHDEITSLITNFKIDEIQRVGYYQDHFYVTRREPGADNFKLYVMDKSGKQQLFIDPQKAHPNIKSNNIMLSTFNFSESGRYLFYSLVVGGNEREPKSVLRNMKTGVEWMDTLYLNPGMAIHAFDPERPDAFYYILRPKYRKPGVDPLNWFDSSMIYHHIIGTNPSTDKLIIDMDTNVIRREADDHLNLFIRKHIPYVFAVVKNNVAEEYRIYAVHKKDFNGIRTKWKMITDFPDKVKDFTMMGSYLYVLTTKNAPNAKVMRIDLSKPPGGNMKELVPESKTIIKTISVTKNELLVNMLDVGQGKLLRINHGGTSVDTLMPPIKGTIDIAWNSRQSSSFIISVNSWTRPVEYFEYNYDAKKFSPSRIQQYHAEQKLELEVKDVLVRSHDGVMVPMTIVHKKGLKLDGSHPITLNGYGAYGALDSQPAFWPEDIAWYEKGGIRAMTYIRGSGVYGEEWYVAGKKATKPNSWKDFIACGEYLIEHKYASPKTLVASGYSAGGITVGRAITERPDLFGGAILFVGILDAVRFETTPNGRGNIPEFGTVKIEAEFNALYEMSTYHHVSDGTHYPAVVLWHGVNDTRVPVWSSTKMAARLQQADPSGRRPLLRLDFDSGHGIQSTISTIIDNTVDFNAFQFWLAGFPDFQPGF